MALRTGPQAAPSTHRPTAAVLSAGTSLRGRVSGEGDLRVEGTVEGEVLMRGALVVAAGGRITGERIEASSLIVAGELAGEVSAEGEVAIEATGSLRGAVRGRSLRIEPGAALSADIDCAFDLPDELRAPSR